MAHQWAPQPRLIRPHPSPNQSMDRFRVELNAATPNPQQCIYAKMTQDYSEGFLAADRTNWPDETPAGEICVKRLLGGERSHYGPPEHALRAKLGAQEVIRVLCVSALAPLHGLGTSDRRLVREEPFAPGAPGPVNGTDGEIGA